MKPIINQNKKIAGSIFSFHLKFLFPAFVLLLCAEPVKPNPVPARQEINIPGLYEALQSGDTAAINSFLKMLNDDSTLLAVAYKGALLMRKSGLMKSAKEKLALFKQGRSLLENAIMKDNKNAEFRFLRLIIQENCPSFLHYHKQKEEDADIVKKSYKNFSGELKSAIVNYAKVSKSIKPADFSN